jgi:hypothetical protein
MSVPHCSCLYIQKKNTWYSLDRRLGAQNYCRCGKQEKQMLLDLTALLPKFQSRRLLLEKHLVEYQTLTNMSAVCRFTY